MKQTYDVVLQRDGLREIVIDQCWVLKEMAEAVEINAVVGYYSNALRCLDDLNEEVKRLRRGLKTLED